MIDPSISLGVKPIQIQDPLEAYGKVQNLMAMRQQQQLHAQQMDINTERLKQEQMANQEAALKQNDDRLNSQTWQQAGGDPAKHIQLLGQAGARPQAVQALQKHYRDLEKETAEIDDKKLAVRKDQNERFAGLIQQASAMSDDQYAAAWPELKAAALAIHPEMKAQLPDAPLPKDVLQHLQLGLVTEKTLLEREEEKRKAKAAQDASVGAADLHAQRGREATEAQRATNASALAQAAKQGPDALTAALAQLPADQRAPFANITAKTTSGEILRIGMKPHEIAAADTAEKNAENNVTDMELELRAAKGDKQAKAALEAKTQRQVRVAIASRDPNVRLDHEIGQYGKPFDEIVKGSDSQLDKILDAEKMLAGGAVSQALGIPKILTALVSGAGSGVRITQAELNSIAKARGLAGDVEGFFSKLSGNGTLTTEQKKQMQGILDDVRRRIVEKRVIARDASNEMMAASSRDEVVKAAQKGRDALDAHSAKGGGGKITVTDPNGGAHTFDSQEKADAFKKAAGIK